MTPSFTSTPTILFLNKKDIFLTRIQHIPLTVCFDDYKGRQAAVGLLPVLNEIDDKLCVSLNHYLPNSVLSALPRYDIDLHKNRSLFDLRVNMYKMLSCRNRRETALQGAL